MSEESIANIIKSCIVSRKGGMPLLEIEDEYRELVGEAIPFVSLGYKTLLEFINSINFVKVRRNYFGDSVLHVSDPKTAHIESLVSKQKNPSSRISNSKRNRKNRFPKGYQGGDRGSINENSRTQGPENFSKNTRMEYTKSKWYSNRAKDSWNDKKNESRTLSRYNNFNSGRTTLPNSSDDSSRQNDNSWNGQITPYRQSSSVEDNSYNFNSEQERSYAHESRSWQFQVRVGDANHNSTVGISQHAEYSHQQCQYGPFPPRQFVGGPTNNYNNGWRDWCPPNYYQDPAPRDNQSGRWWPGLHGSANTLFPWMGVPQVHQINPSPPWQWNYGHFCGFPMH